MLLSLLLPGLAAVRETARRVVCASNVRQSGLGLAMYCDDYRGYLPPSRFGAPSNDLHRLTQVRLNMALPRAWDGLGMLYAHDYLNAPEVYYCPSNQGEHAMAVERPKWTSEAQNRVFSNYHFRGPDTTAARMIWRLDPSTSMVSDAITSASDYSHAEGANVLYAGLAVKWLNDPAKYVLPLLPTAADSAINASKKVATVWTVFDQWDTKPLQPAVSEPDEDQHKGPTNGR